jgi:hypothetical protein
MKRWLFLMVTGVAAVPAVRLLMSQQGAAPQPERQPITVLLRLGEKAAEEERWDGSVRVSGGTLVSVTGRHFSEGDEVQPENRWRCTTRRDAVAPYADLHYTEMRPGSQPPVWHQPVGVYVKIDGAESARVSVETVQGNFEFTLSDAQANPAPVLGGKASFQRVPTVESITTGMYEDDEPSAAFLNDGSLAVAWVGYRDRADKVLLRIRRGGRWSEPEELTGGGDHFRTSAAAAGDTLWVFWNRRDGERWSLWGRSRTGTGAWSAPENLSGAGTTAFHRAAAGPDGSVHLVWQSFRDGQSDIYVRSWKGSWSKEAKLSESRANDWEPAVAGGPDGTAHVAWDSYDKGNYDIHYRSAKGGTPGTLRAITQGPRFQAQASVAVDSHGRPWVAWNESGINWGKDQGFLIPVPLATPLHQQRWIKVVAWDGGRWVEPNAEPVFPGPMRYNSEHPQLMFDGSGRLVMAFRHWTRRLSRSIGAVMGTENFISAYDGSAWSAPQPVENSISWIEKLPTLARAADGSVWAAWASDNRPFSTMIPKNSDVYAARVAPSSPARIEAAALRAYHEPWEEAIPVHTNDAADVAAIRGYTITSAGKNYKIFRGDMHRHTDFSQDPKYDGSLFEVYRYAFDAAGFDYIAPTDHQTGYDQEFSWWQHEKYVDLFLVPGRMTPIFGYERSLQFPNGHRNVIRPQRGVRPLPIPKIEASGQEGAKKLFEHLKATNGISMPHSIATAQGTNWRDNDPQVEPLVEIYQGYRASYEYEGAPKAATELNQHAQKSGWQPEGFFWNALAKGYKLGVQASSDHWSTHISYACLLVEGPSREQMMDAIRKRHAYAATDNIILDYRVRAGGKEYIQGDAFDSTAEPTLIVKTTGTNTIKQIDIVKDKTFLYTARPGAKTASFEYTDKNSKSGESWYYVRVLQEDGQIAWSSPVWVKR